MLPKITGNKIKIGKISKTSIYDIPYYITDNRNVSKPINGNKKKLCTILLKILINGYQTIKKYKKIFNVYSIITGSSVGWFRGS